MMSLIGFRQYMHRMVMCLEEEVLPFVPLIIKQLLESQHPKSLLDFIPFMMQIISKFKVKNLMFLMISRSNQKLI